MADDSTEHMVAVIGGATAGAEVASRLADRGVAVFVFEQNSRPYGKIEDGLPRWHEALRLKEYRTIDEKLTKRGVHFIPNTKIGADIGFRELVDDLSSLSDVERLGLVSDQWALARSGRVGIRTFLDLAAALGAAPRYMTRRFPGRSTLRLESPFQPASLFTDTP